LLGFGSGITGAAVLSHPVERLTIAENCKPVLEAGHHFNQWNRGVLTNERTVLRNDDARTVLKLSQTKYDVIINEPSNPWVAGVGSIFSKEFYDLCKSRLAEGGVVAQWFHTYEMSDYIIFLVLRTFAASFPYMEVWDTQEGDIVMLGAPKPWESSPAQYQKVWEHPQVRKDLEEIKINSAVALWARQIASQKTGFAIGGDGPIQTDEFPILEYKAPEAFFVGQEALKLHNFDERTVQFPLADRTKIAALRALPEHILVESFTDYQSSNPDVRMFIQALHGKALDRVDPSGHIVFRQPHVYPEVPPMVSNATPEFAECLKLESQMLRDMSKWKEPATRIEGILTELISKNMLNPRDFSPAYYAGLVARFAMGDNDLTTALRVLRLGMIFSSSNEQLQYLTRVLDRLIPKEVVDQFLKEEAEKKAKAI
jgi:hypothetical protein